MNGEISGREISVTIEGSLLPPIQSKEYTNVSDRYLMVWLELLVNEMNNTDEFFSAHSRQIKVS